MLTGRTSVLWVCGTVVLLAASGAGAGEIRYHGASIDDQNQIILEQEDNTIRVGILSRGRTVAGKPIEVLPGVVEGETGRLTDADFLLEMTVEVLKPAAPNNFQNPGTAYRITVHGLRLFPDYVLRVDTDALHARDVIFAEFEKFWSRCGDPEREALFRAAPLTIEAFKESDKLPAEIFKAVMMTKTGQFRIATPTLQRRSIRPAQVFAPQHETGRPEAGATLRSRAKQEQGLYASSYMEVQGVGLVPVPTGPRTPAAAAAAESVEAAQRAGSARAGQGGRVVTWAPTGAGIGQYVNEPNLAPPIGEYGP